MSARSLKASSKGIEKANLLLARYGLNQRALADDLGISRHTVSKFFRGIRIDRDNFASICERLGLELEEAVLFTEGEVGYKLPLVNHETEQNAAQEIKIDIDQALKLSANIGQFLQSGISSVNLISEPPVLEKWQGRDKEIELLRGWLVDDRIKTIGIQGLSGIGKSWLASYIYESSVEESDFHAIFWADMSQFPDFTVFIKNALFALANKTINELQFIQESNQLINELLKCLKQKRILLVIDNLETLLDEERCFIGAYKNFMRSWNERGSSISKLILTTQIRPLVMEREGSWLNLQGLDAYNGAILLKKLGIQGDKLELQEFANLMGGHPKVLRLVASLLFQYKSNPHISEVEKLALRHIEKTLNGLNMPYRDKEKVLFVSILEGHFSSLELKLRSFLMNLTIYRGRCFRWQAAAVVLAEGENTASFLDTQTALSEILGRSLLDKVEIKNEYQFQFHPFVWQYIRQKAEADGQSENLRNKVITYYQSMSNNDSNTWKTLDDIASYLEIFYHRCEQNQYEEAFNTLLICDKFLDIHGYNSIRVELYERLAELWKPVESERGKFADALVHLGSAYYLTGQMPKGVETCRQALEIAQQVGERRIEADALGWMGGCYRSLGEYQRALELHEQAVKIAREIGYYDWEAACLINVGNDYYFLKQYQKQLEAYESALEVARSISNRRWEAYSLGGLGFAYQALEQYQQAIEHREQALDICREVKDRREEGYSLWGLGNAYCSTEQFHKAVEYHNQALTIFEEINDFRGICITLDSLGELYSASNQPQKAIESYQKLLDMQQEANNPQAETSILEKLNNLQLAIGLD